MSVRTNLGGVTVLNHKYFVDLQDFKGATEIIKILNMHVVGKVAI